MKSTSLSLREKAIRFAHVPTSASLQLRIKSRIGVGSYGEVLLAEYRGTEVGTARESRGARSAQNNACPRSCNFLFLFFAANVSLLSRLLEGGREAPMGRPSPCPPQPPGDPAAFAIFPHWPERASECRRWPAF